MNMYPETAENDQQVVFGKCRQNLKIYQILQTGKKHYCLYGCLWLMVKKTYKNMEKFDLNEAR